jgi:hypothetical protein
MCNHLNLKILIHIFTIIYLIIIIIMRDENFVAHIDGLGGTPVCRGAPVAHHCIRVMRYHRQRSPSRTFSYSAQPVHAHAQSVNCIL